MAKESDSCESSDCEWMRVKRELDNLSLSSEQGHRPIGVALIGLGRMGTIHMRNLMREPRANLLYCFDSDQCRLRLFANSALLKQKQVKVLPSESFQLALEDANVQAVIISTPSNFHELYTRQALLAGKNVLCEKPLTPNTEGILPLYKLASDKKVFLLCAFNRHYDPDFRQLRNRSLQKSTFGSIQLVRVTARDCIKPPLDYLGVSSGLFHDTVVHDIDMAIWFMRQLPVSVQVMGKTWKEYYESEPSELTKLSDKELAILREIDDYFLAVVTMKFPNGSLCLLDNSREALYGYDQRCEVYGSKGTLKCDARPAVNTVELTSGGVLNSTMNYTFASRYKVAYMNELQELITMTEITMEKAYDDAAKVRKRLMEPVRPSLVFATSKIATACSEAAKSEKAVHFNWEPEFERTFNSEINS